MPRVPRTKPVKVTQSLATGIVAGTLDAPVVSSVMDVRDATDIEIEVDFTRGGAATAIVMTLEEADAVGGPFSVMMDVAAGAATPRTITRTTSLSERFSLPFDVTPWQFVRLTFTGTASTIDDTITVTVNKTGD